MSLPFDSSDPAIRLMLKHVRLQALTPMAVLMNMTATIICALVLQPSTSRIASIFGTPFNASPGLMGTYFLVMEILLIGYCAVLILAGKTETKETLVHGVGLRLVFLQWIQAANVICFTLKWFLASLILTSISLALLIWIQITITIYRRPSSSSLAPHNQNQNQNQPEPTTLTPLDRLWNTLFIHAPLHLLLALTFLQDLPQLIFIVLGWYFNLVKEEDKYDRYSWQATAFIVSFHAAVLIVMVAWRLDWVWAVAGFWIALSQLSQRPKAANVFGSLVTFTILYPVVFISMVFIWRRINAQKEAQAQGAIRLPDDDDAEEQAEVARVRARHHQGNGANV